jgi:hypothetical protein
MILLLLAISIFYSCGPVDSTVTYNQTESKPEEKFKTVEPEKRVFEQEETGVTYWDVEHNAVSLTNFMRPGTFKVHVEFNDVTKDYKVAYQLEGYPADCENGEVYYKDDTNGGVIAGLEEGEIYYVVVCAVSEEGEVSKGLRDKVRTLTSSDLEFSFNMQVVLDGSQGINSEWLLTLSGINKNVAKKVGIRWNSYHWEGQKGTDFKSSYEIITRTTCDSPTTALELALVNENGEFSEWVIWQIPENEKSCYYE